MLVCLYISLFILHFSAGCNLSNERQTKEVIGYTGGSVLLPCSCDDPQATVKTFKWEVQYNKNLWINAFQHENYTGRLKMFYENSPKNLSLLISDLREEDSVYYMCVTEPYSVGYVMLTVTGCLLDRHTQLGTVTGYLGRSVVLPCSCTEPLAKPDRLKWKYYMENFQEIYPNEHIERYKNRGKLLNQTTPGNLSLHLSSLTKEDDGYYQCFVSSNKYILVRLYVREKPPVHVIYSLTYQPSQQTHERIQRPEDIITHRPHHTTLYVLVLIAAFVSILVFLVFNSWGCKGGENVQIISSDGPELIRDPQNEDKYPGSGYSGVFFVNQHPHKHSCRIVQ